MRRMAAALVALIVVLAGCDRPGIVFDPASNRPATPAPLTWAGHLTRAELPIGANALTYDATLVVFNRSVDRVVIRDVDLTSNGVIEVVHRFVREVDPDDRSTEGGLQLSYPPRRNGDRLVEAAGAGIAPGRSYEIVLVLRLIDEQAQIVAVRLSYDIGRGHIPASILFSHRVTLCTGRPAGATLCAPRPGIRPTAPPAAPVDAHVQPPPGYRAKYRWRS